jgi:hypothetical protein
MKPGDTDALTDRTIIHGRTKCFDRTYDLMPRNDRRTSYIEIALDHMKVGPADTASVNSDQNFVRARLGNRHIIEAQGVCFNGRGGV